MVKCICIPAFAVLSVLGHGSALAQTGDGIAISANVAAVSDYRGRGLTISDNEAAIQGGVDVALADGWSAGAWASSMAETDGADTEVDLYGAKTFVVGSAEVSIGGTYYVFPGGEDLDYAEAQASVAQSFGPIDTTLAVAYAWDQENLGGDNTYVAVEAVAPLGLAGPVSFGLAVSLGYETGVMAVETSKVDWMSALTAEYRGIELSLAYIGASIDDPGGDDGFVLAIGTAF